MLRHGRAALKSVLVSTSNSNSNSTGLDSYALAAKVSKIAPKDIESAIRLVQSSTSNSSNNDANIVVWNTLIHNILLQNLHNKAFTLWMDMKRRGLTPSPRSFTTFFSGHARIARHWSNDPATGGRQKALDQVRTVYAQWLKYVGQHEARATTDRSNTDFRRARGNHVQGWEQDDPDIVDGISTIPTNAFINFLGNAGRPDLVVETFKGLPSTGLLAPDSSTYSTILAALRPHIRPNNNGALGEFNQSFFDTAMDVWNRLESECESSDSPTSQHIDTRTVSLMLTICRDAIRPDDQLKGYSLASKFFGFVTSSSRWHELESESFPSPKVRLDSAALSIVLALALKLHKSNETIRIFDQVRDYPGIFGKGVVDFNHVDLALVAYGNRRDTAGAEALLHWSTHTAPAACRPELSTYSNALQVAWRAADLSSAYRILALLPEKIKSQSQPRIATTFLQTALAGRNRGEIAKALRVVAEDFGFGFEAWNTSLPSSSNTEKMSRRDDKSTSSPPKTPSTLNAFWRYRLASAIEASVEKVLRGGTEEVTLPDLVSKILSDNNASDDNASPTSDEQVPVVKQKQELSMEAREARKEQKNALEHWAKAVRRWKEETFGHKEVLDLHQEESMEGRRRLVARTSVGGTYRAGWSNRRVDAPDMRKDYDTLTRAKSFSAKKIYRRGLEEDGNSRRSRFERRPSPDFDSRPRNSSLSRGSERFSRRNDRDTDYSRRHGNSRQHYPRDRSPLEGRDRPPSEGRPRRSSFSDDRHPSSSRFNDRDL
ncbi:hypothetical protein T439DRAFT_324761 [Meredithblackwellia eburnea MCA 4105]